MKKDLSLYCLKYARSVLSESMIFAGGNSEKNLPISFAFYLIKIKDRNILIDAGCDTMPGFDMEKFYSPAFVLREADISPDRITDVIITHSHHDHIEGIKHFGNAVVHITNEEYISGKKYIREDMKINIIDDEYEIANGVRIIKIGGHSVGSAVVEIENKDITYVIAGDECYSDKCIELKIPTGSSQNEEKSKYFIEKYSDKKYNVLTMHDIKLKTEKII